ncbi:hypothetical protein M433DRAFT_26037 [Acidomyces richmondensis BFW]|nr:hypothetical protein M433DRAFT_26037 [Acidomyces richmondensis BFW]
MGVEAIMDSHPPSSGRSRKAPPTIVTGANNERRSSNTATTRPMLQPTGSSSPAPSGPPTPNLSTTRRPSHVATSPLQPPPAQSPRRASSAMGLPNTRPGSSTGTPQRTARVSRHSLGGGAGEQAPDDERRPTPKRSISNLIANLREAQGGSMEVIAEPVPLTATGIAIDHFTRELRAHSDDGVESQTVVILHDACYGHRYSRLKTTKATLALIVERPERIAASVLGVAAAYVRLGAHHAGAKHAPHPDRQHVAPPPFKIRRTARSMDITSSCVTNVHGTAWMAELQRMCCAAGDRLAAGAKELNRVQDPSEPEKRQLHEGDLYLCPESLNAFQGALGGVADAVDAVFTPATSTRRAFVAIRPPGHHCSADHPSGFCWLNNVHVGIEYAAQTYGLTHAAILDFDLHHGDGSQAITWERNSRNNQKRLNAKPSSKLKLSPDVGYYSLHDINSYPCEMGDDEKVQAASLCVENAHGQSVWNVHLQPWKTEDEFWELYETRYKILFEKAKVFLRHHTARLRAELGGKMQPRAAIFISAGFDASEWEGAGMQRHKVNVPTEFYARFTRDVVGLAQEAGSGCEGRVISVLEGGYSDRALCSGVLSHLSGLCAQSRDAVKKEEGLDVEASLDEMMRGLHIDQSPATLFYDNTWWSPANLTALEMKVNPPPPPGPGKKARVGPQPTYATPTESFAYKVVDPNKFARSISGTLREAPTLARPPTPPPPEVDWIVATQELHRLLIPLDRSTQSCTAEELGGVRQRKDRQSAMPILSTEESVRPRQLRERKAKVPTSTTTPHSHVYAGSTHSDELESVRSASRASSSTASRRQTLHDFPPPSHSDPVGKQDGLATQQDARNASRRLSMGSTMTSIDGIPEQVLQPPVPALPRQVVSNGDGMKAPRTSASGPTPRPSSAMGGMQIKKTRAPPKARKSPIGSHTAESSTAALTGNISSSLQTTSLTPSEFSSRSAHQQVAPEPASQSPSNVGVDILTSGMKKITLKVGSKEEHERKQKEREAAERRARALKGAETRRVNAAAKKAAAAAEAKRKEGSMTNASQEEGTKTGIPQPSLMLPPMRSSETSAHITPSIHAPEMAQSQPSFLHPEPMMNTDAQNTLSGSPVLPRAPMDDHILANNTLDTNLFSITPAEPLLFSAGSVASPSAYDTSQLTGVSEMAFRYISGGEAKRISSPLTAEHVDMEQEPVSAKQAPPPSLPTPPRVPDSPTRQLMQDNDTPKDLHAVEQHSSAYVISPTGDAWTPGGRKLPVWNTTGPIPVTASRAMEPPGVTTEGYSNRNETDISEKGESQRSQGDISPQTTAPAKPSGPEDENNIWEVPDTSTAR